MRCASAPRAKIEPTCPEDEDDRSKSKGDHVLVYICQKGIGHLPDKGRDGPLECPAVREPSQRGISSSFCKIYTTSSSRTLEVRT